MELKIFVNPKCFPISQVHNQYLYLCSDTCVYTDVLDWQNLTQHKDL